MQCFQLVPLLHTNMFTQNFSPIFIFRKSNTKATLFSQLWHTAHLFLFFLFKPHQFSQSYACVKWFHHMVQITLLTQRHLTCNRTGCTKDNKLRTVMKLFVTIKFKVWKKWIQIPLFTYVQKYTNSYLNRILPRVTSLLFTLPARYYSSKTRQNLLQDKGSVPTLHVRFCAIFLG